MADIQQTFDDAKRRLAAFFAELISKQSPPLATLGDDGLPTGPAIAAESEVGRAGFGKHASVYLAREEAGQLKKYAIDLFMAFTSPDKSGLSKGRDPRQGDLDWAAELGSKVFAKERSPGQPMGIRIKIRPADNWANPGTSRTWSITPLQAEAAWQAAQDRQNNADTGKYYFSAMGMGPGGYNCSKMAAEIVQAAGVDASSGLLIHTPGELALGTKGPNEGLIDPDSNEGVLDGL
jgi:hypothetical protein